MCERCETERERARKREAHALKEKPFTFNAALDPAVASVALNLLSVQAREREQ